MQQVLYLVDFDTRISRFYIASRNLVLQPTRWYPINVQLLLISDKAVSCCTVCPHSGLQESALFVVS